MLLLVRTEVRDPLTDEILFGRLSGAGPSGSVSRTELELQAIRGQGAQTTFQEGAIGVNYATGSGDGR